MKTLSDFNFGNGVTATLIDPQQFRLFKIKSGKKHYFNLDKFTGKQSHTTKQNKAYVYHKEDYYMLYLVLMSGLKNYVKQGV